MFSFQPASTKRHVDLTHPNIILKAQISLQPFLPVNISDHLRAAIDGVDAAGKMTFADELTSDVVSDRTGSANDRYRQQ